MTRVTYRPDVCALSLPSNSAGLGEALSSGRATRTPPVQVPMARGQSPWPFFGQPRPSARGQRRACWGCRGRGADSAIHGGGQQGRCKGGPGDAYRGTGHHRRGGTLSLERPEGPRQLVLRSWCVRGGRGYFRRPRLARHAHPGGGFRQPGLCRLAGYFYLQSEIRADARDRAMDFCAGKAGCRLENRQLDMVRPSGNQTTSVGWAPPTTFQRVAVQSSLQSQPGVAPVWARVI